MEGGHEFQLDDAGKEKRETETSIDVSRKSYSSGPIYIEKPKGTGKLSRSTSKGKKGCNTMVLGPKRGRITHKSLTEPKLERNQVGQRRKH